MTTEKEKALLEFIVDQGLEIVTLLRAGYFCGSGTVDADKLANKLMALRSGILLEEGQKYYSDEDADFDRSAKAADSARKGGW